MLADRNQYVNSFHGPLILGYAIVIVDHAR